MKFRIKQWCKMLAQKGLLPFVYWLFHWSAIDDNLILFADAHHSSRPESMNCLYQALQGSKYTVKELYTDYGKVGYGEVLKSMLSFMRLYARAGVVVICDNFLPVTACKKKKGTRVIQLWHGAGALKKFGYDAKDDIPEYYKGNVYRNYDLVTVSSEACVGAFCSAMRLPVSQVQPMGISRTDSYFKEDYIVSCKEMFYHRFPEAKGKHILLWAPTFRGNAAIPKLEGMEDLEKLEASLGDEWMVVYSLHPHLLNVMEVPKNVADLSTEQLLPVADVVVTDYSSIVYDSILLDKPVVMYAPDLEEFQKKRGFYLALEEYPGQIVTEEIKLQQAVLDAREQYDYDRACRFKATYLAACDGNATSRILEYIQKN